MPTYEYKCENCGHEFETIQSMKDKPLVKCPQCGEMKLKKLVSRGAGLIFKGSGFYLTDYKNKPAEKKSTEKTTKTDNATSDTKTATTTSETKSDSTTTTKTTKEKSTETKK